ncbi:Rv1733c family protein [Streptomyces sp. NPDC054783]
MHDDKPTSRKPKRMRRPLWRWRSNPVRRHDDVLEAWLLLAMWMLIVVGGTVAGAMTACAADRSFAQQRAERTPVRAVLRTDVPYTAVSEAGGDLVSAKVRWTAADGSTHSGRTLVTTSTGRRAGSTVGIWIDHHGRLSAQPPTPGKAAVEASLLGAAAALALSGLVFGLGSTGRLWLDRRRMEQWDAEWTLVGPRWGHMTN